MKRGLFENTEKPTMLIVTVLIAAILAESLALAQVNVEPNTAVLNEGDKTDLLCRYGRPITYCRIEIPGEKVLNLSPDWNKTPSFTYYGAGLNTGQCGVSIDHVKATNNGEVKCSLGVEGEELSGKINLVVALRPQQPLITLLTKPERDGTYVEGTTFQARCSVRNGRPAANVSWYIDDLPANKRVGQLDVRASKDNPELSDTEQEIQWVLGPEDNGRKLICRSHHQTDRENVPPQEGGYLMLVRFSPVRQPEINVYGLYLEHTAVINVTIRANPQPNIEWTIDGVVIREGEQKGRFAAHEPQYLGQDYYNVTLTVAGLTLEDTTKIYQLTAQNGNGRTDYQVRISSSNAPPSAGLDIAAIVGIVVAIAILVIVVLLILFARATGRWCFGGKSLKTPANETDDKEQHGQNVALLETPNGVTIIPNISDKDTNGHPSYNQERNSVERRHHDDDNTSFEYATDRESSVYNPTTIPLKQVIATAGGRNSQRISNGLDSSEKEDLLKRGNQLGIPESRFSKWIPKDQREILEKQAKLLSNRMKNKAPQPNEKNENSQTSETPETPTQTPKQIQPIQPIQPIQATQQTQSTDTNTTPISTQTTMKATNTLLPQETEI